MHITEKHVEIEAPVERVFDLFSDFESFPRWMKNIKEVRYTGRRFTRWTALAPLGTEVEWEAETTLFEPDRRIAWRSVRGDVDTEGEVLFEETRRGTTLMRVVLGYALPAGRLGEMIARLFGKNPDKQLEDDLERFAAVVERRRRGARRARYERERDPDERRRRAVHERIIEPRERRRPTADDVERGPRFDERRGFAARDHAERDYYAARQQSRHEEMPRRERNARAGFEKALRSVRRIHLEDQRRYAAERERREREREHERHYEDAREYEHDERWEMARRREADERYDEEEHRRGPRRHALTPRERERERRDFDEDYPDEAFRRGVDKLMHEPPSRRWRRWE